MLHTRVSQLNGMTQTRWLLNTPFVFVVKKYIYMYIHTILSIHIRYGLPHCHMLLFNDKKSHVQSRVLLQHNITSLRGKWCNVAFKVATDEDMYCVSCSTSALVASFPRWEQALGHSGTSAQTNAIWQVSFLVCVNLKMYFWPFFFFLLLQHHL